MTSAHPRARAAGCLLPAAPCFAGPGLRVAPRDRVARRAPCANGVVAGRRRRGIQVRHPPLLCCPHLTGPHAAGCAGLSCPILRSADPADGGRPAVPLGGPPRRPADGRAAHPGRSFPRRTERVRRDALRREPRPGSMRPRGGSRRAGPQQRLCQQRSALGRRAGLCAWGAPSERRDGKPLPAASTRQARR